MKGIYQYKDLKNDEIVYTGKDSHIDKNQRHKDHTNPYRYDEQQINRVVQNNPDRYKYGVICAFDDLSNDELTYLEIKEIMKHKFLHDELPKFNFTIGGEGTTGYKHTDETKNKISKANKGENHPNYGKTLSDETRKKMSEAHKGEKNNNYSKTASDKTRKKMSEVHKGEKNSFYGKTHSDESKKKMSEAHKGKTLSEEHKQKISINKNTTGYMNVTKEKDKACKQGFMWKYQYHEDGKQKSIRSVDIEKLEKKVKAKGLKWKKLEENDLL